MRDSTGQQVVMVLALILQRAALHDGDGVVNVLAGLIVLFSAVRSIIAIYRESFLTTRPQANDKPTG